MLDQFYRDVLVDGQHVVATLNGSTIQHYAVNSTEDIIPFLSQFEDVNTYHSLGAYKGLTEGKLHSVKDLQGCTGVRGWAFDLDVGDKDTEYDSLEEAFESLMTAVTEGHIPEPRWTLYSGGGLQFYLLQGGEDYETGLPEETWATRFLSLKRLMMQHLKIDRTVGSHPYRLLRSPCTPNWKYEEPVWPTLLNEEPGPLLPEDFFQTLPVVEPKQVTKHADSSLNVDRPVGLKSVLKACAAMKHEYQTQGEKTPEPRWLATANICAHTREFRRGFHKLSKAHPTYNEAEANAKFSHVVESVAAGPMGCEHFGDSTDPDSPCHGCWAAAAGYTNPISATRNLGKAKPVIPIKQVPVEEPEEVEEEVELDDIVAEEELNEENNYGIPEHHLPANFETDGDMIFDDTGPIMSQVWCRPLQFNELSQQGNVMFSADNKEWHLIAARKLAQPGTCAAELLNYGIMVYNDKKAAQYMRQATMLDGRRQEAGHFGWGPDFKCALLPTGSVGKLSVQPGLELDKLKRKWGRKAGSLEGWLDAIRIYERPGQEPYLMAVLASLASPLLSYHNLQKGVILSLTGVGGAGKTTALKACSSVWGYPLSTLATMSSTSTATRIYLSMCGHLPMILDELTQMAPEELKQLALEISQGAGRERGKADGGLADSETWHLNLITTSNTSLHQKLAELIDSGGADMNRVVEVPIILSENVSTLQGAELESALLENHGHLGELFMQGVIEEDTEQERKAFLKLYRALHAKDGLKGTDRFAASLIASCYWAHKRIKKQLPDFPGDPDVMFLWMRRQLMQNNKFIENVLNVRIPSIEDFVLDYAAENLVLIPATGKGYMAQGQSMKGYVYDYGEWYVIPKSTLENWCKRQMLKSRTVLESWGRSGRLRNMSRGEGQTRFTGKLEGGLLLDGKKQYPTVTLVHKGKGDAASNRGSDSSAGEIEEVTVPSKANRVLLHGE